VALKIMYVYFKNNEDLKKIAPVMTTQAFFKNKLVSSYELGPHIDVEGSLVRGSLKDDEDFKKLFLKATERHHPNYERSRQRGLYAYGEAKAELITQQNGDALLIIETESIDGLNDMEVLRQKIAAGTILPKLSYNKEQRKDNPINIFRQFLAERKLSFAKKLFFVWRLVWA
jgi:hypothetical protein